MFGLGLISGVAAVFVVYGVVWFVRRRREMLDT
jgi:hypothetical protein